MNEIFLLSTLLKRNGVPIYQKKSLVTHSDYNYGVYEFPTDGACKAKLYWYGPRQKKYIYPPGVNIFTGSALAIIPSEIN